MGLVQSLNDLATHKLLLVRMKKDNVILFLLACFQSAEMAQVNAFG
jgi:hypothetical protein